MQIHSETLLIFLAADDTGMTWKTIRKEISQNHINIAFCSWQQGILVKGLQIPS